MALDSVDASKAMTSNYLDYVGYKESFNEELQRVEYEIKENPYKFDSTKTPVFFDTFVDQYDIYAREGASLPLGILDPTGGDKTILRTAFNNMQGNGFDNAVILGTAFSNYWATMYVTTASNAPGHTHSGPITNTSVALVNDFINAVRASYTTSERRPFFKKLIDNVESVVNTVVWSVPQTNNSTSNTTVFLETLS